MLFELAGPNKSMTPAKRYINGQAAVVSYWLIGLPGTLLLVIALNWAYVELSSLAYSYRHLFPEELVTNFGKKALVAGLLLILVPPYLAFNYAVYVGTARAAQRTTGWTSNFLWMGLGGHASITILFLLFTFSVWFFR